MLGIILPSILILVALISIGFLVYRTYPQLTLIKEDTIPEIREAKKKYDIVKRRLEERAKKQKTAGEIQFVPFQVVWNNIQQQFRNKVNAIAEQVRAEQTSHQQKALSELSTEEKQQQAKEKIRDAKRAYDQDEFEFAEKCFIEAIRIDPHAVDAYRGLAQVYIAQDQLIEAKETYHFLHQLSPSDDSILLQLAEIAELEGDIRSAVAYYEQALLINDSHAVRFAKLGELLNRLEEYETAFEAWGQAVELEPQNPKYLDNLIETGIMVEQIGVVEQALQQLRTVNPENKKITIFQDKLRLLKEKQITSEE
jgi:tetratricopeptide (TPR) repeat protein